MGWKRPRKGITVPPLGVPCRLKTARQSELKGCGLEFRAPGLDVITAREIIQGV